MNRSPGHIEALTSLRFLAALIVVVFHHGQAAFAGAPSWLLNVIKGGYVGVPFFFILSGFILAYNYGPQVQEKTFAARRFWLARFARIYPVYAVSLVIAAPLFLATTAQSTSPEAAAGRFALQTVTHGALLQSWIPGWAFAWNGPAWSLSVEAFFYLLFPFLMTGLSPRGRWWALAAFVVAGGLAVGIRKLVPSWDAVGAAQKLLGWSNPLLWLPLFLAGICAGERHLEGRGVGASKRLRAGWNGALSLGAVTLILGLMAANLQRLSQLLYCYALTLPSALLICLAARNPNGFSRLLSSKILVLLGEASYSLYILHRPVHDWFSWMERTWSFPSTSTSTGFMIYLTVCLASSIVTLKAIEYPCRDWIKRRFALAMPGLVTESAPRQASSTYAAPL